MSRESSTYQSVRSHLAYLKLAAAAERLAPALEAAERERPSYADFLDSLPGAEVEATEARRLERRLRLAGFPHRKALVITSEEFRRPLTQSTRCSELPSDSTRTMARWRERLCCYLVRARASPT